MDFQSLNRRELQALCKRNKIPANITNVAMAEALANLQNVEGLEDLMTGKIFSDTPAKTAVKPSASRTNARTSNLTSTRTHVATKKPVAGEEGENAAPVDLVRRKMDSQLNEAADEEKKGMDTPAPRVPVSRRKTSVREVCSTRRSTRLLQKMNLEDAVDHNVVEGISQEKKPSDLQEKTDVSDEKPVVVAVLPQDGPMDENNEDYVLVDHKDAELIEENKDIGGPTDGLVFENQKGINTVEAYKAESVNSEEKSESDETVNGFITKDDIVAEESMKVEYEETLATVETVTDKVAEESMKVEYEETLATVETVTDFINYNETGADESMKAEAEENFAMTEIVTDSINRDEEPKPEESMEMEVFQIGEAKSEVGVVSVVKDETEVEATMELEVSQISKGKSEQGVVVSIVKDETQAKESMEASLAMNETVTDSSNKDESKLEESVKMEIVEGKFEGEVSAGFRRPPNVETIAFETAPVVSEMEDVISDFSERKSPEATEKTLTLLDTNKENFVKEKKEKVKKEDISIRQLKKMLKQLNIADKTTSIKEGENTAKEIGQARPALQPLADN